MKSLAIAKKFLLSLLGIVIIISSFGCAEQKPFKPLPINRQRVEKALFMADEKKRFIFGETVTKVPVETTDIDTLGEFPGMQRFESKMIRFKFEEKYLNIIEITTYTQSAISNPENAAGSERIISRYPIEKHIDIRKKLDDYNDKTNIQEETEELGPWNTRKYAIIDFGKEEIIDRGLFVEQYGNLQQDFTILQQAMGDLQELELGDDALNITVRKSFKNESGIVPSGNLVEVRYSFLPEPKSSYKPLEYPLAWEKKMGFFRTDIVGKDKYGNRIFKSLANRWDPAKPITFYLSESWNNDDVKQFKPVAYQAVAEWNKVLKEATGIDDFITLKESDGTQRMGDLRYNMIQWIDETFGSSPLGYGPSTAHPETGEIINANLYIYGGALRQSIQVIMQREDITLPDDPSFSSVVSDAISSVKEYFSSEETNTSRLATVKLTSLKDQLSYKRLSKNIKKLNSAEQLKVIKATFNKSKEQTIASVKEMKSFAQMNKNMTCVYPMPYDKITDGIAQGMNQGDLARDILIGTLVHEMGHNLGLRHNFRGSMDKNNFYNDADGDDFLEAARDADGKIIRDSHGHPVMVEKMQSSSVMDYEYNFLHELDRPGKYDAAAIKRTYQNEKPLTINKDAQGKDEIDDVFNYQYCTDQQVYDDALCARFDKGTSAAEIVDNLAKDYHRFYKVHNIPFVKKYYTRETTQAYLSRIVTRFFIPIRVVIDYRNKRYIDLRYDQDIKEVDDVDGFIARNENTQNPDSALIHKLNACREIKDLNDAVINSYKLFVSAMYNDKEDLEVYDEYNGELQLIGYLYDRLWSSMFLSIESAGIFGLNYRGITRYPDLLDQKYFKDRGYSAFKFYEDFSYAPGGWFAKYDYATGTYATKENSNELDKSNMFYFLLRPYVYEILLSEMNGLGSSSDLYSVIKTDTASGDSLAIINQKGINSFKKFNKEMDTLYEDSNMIQSKYYALHMKTTADFFKELIPTIPDIDTTSADQALIDLKNRVETLKNKMVEYQKATDKLATDLDVYEKPETYEPLFRYYERTEDAVFQPYYLMPQYFDFEISSNKLYIYPCIVDDLMKRGILGGAAVKIILNYYLNYIKGGSQGKIVDMYLNFLKIPGFGEGLFNDDKVSMVYDSMKGKIITTPVDSIITNEVSKNHHQFKSQEYMLKRSLDLATSPDPVEEEKGYIMMAALGVDLNELPGMIDSYRTFTSMDRDMLYVMSDLYRQIAPGTSW